MKTFPDTLKDSDWTLETNLAQIICPWIAQPNPTLVCDWLKVKTLLKHTTRGHVLDGQVKAKHGLNTFYIFIKLNLHTS